jgi:glycosyltransferase involved in cell wall biosynthesis
MPVHNALPYLDEAVESILKQTLSDFEFVILDDASTDGSRERLRHWAAADSRIRLLEVQKGLGPVGSSNTVANAATAAFVARMDADDISKPTRLAEQFALLRSHVDVGVVAVVCDMIDAEGTKVRDAEVWRLSRRSVFVPFAHGAMMYRREVFDQVGGYRTECEYWEDQDLVTRMARISKIMVIPRPLYRVRQSTTSTRAISDQERLERALDMEFQAIDQIAQGDNCQFGKQATREKLDPRVFIALGSVQLWAGRRPHLFQRLLSHGKLACDIATVSAFIWTAWASLSPSSLRAFLKFLLRIRNRLALRRIAIDHVLYWTPLEGVRLAEDLR